MEDALERVVVSLSVRDGTKEDRLKTARGSYLTPRMDVSTILALL